MESSPIKKPLLLFAVVFCSGIAVAGCLKMSAGIAYLFAALFLLACPIFQRQKPLMDIFTCCAIFLFGAALLKNSQVRSKCDIANFISEKRDSNYTIGGLVYSRPRSANHSGSFIFNARQIESSANFSHTCCGKILVRGKSGDDFDCGDNLILRGSFDRFSGAKISSGSNYLYRQGISAVMDIGAAVQVLRVNAGKRPNIRKFLSRIKENFEQVIYKYLKPLPAAILDAMVLGEKNKLPPSVNNSMIKSGTIHILVVSGFNVGIVSFVIILLLRLIRLAKRQRFYVLSVLLLMYCLMTGASTPVVRATIMAVIFIFSYFVKREPDVLNSCAIAGIGILVINPQQLFDVGFQLSFASVISIICLYPRIKSILRPSVLKNKYTRFLIEGALVSLSAWLGTAGFVAYYFKIVSPVTVFANLLIVPLASLATLCGFSLLIIGPIFPILAQSFASSIEVIISLLLNINNFFINIPGAYFYLN